MKLKDLIPSLEVLAFRGDPEAVVKGVSCDSRKVGCDYLFAAIQGSNFNAHDFLPSAREGGATSFLSEQPPSFSFSECNWIQVPNVRQAVAQAALAVHGRPDRRIPFIGVTGTNGKTTVTYILEAMLRAAGRNPARMGTVTYRYGETEVQAGRTTPEAPDILAFASAAAAGGADALIMEVSAHALSLYRVYGFEFDTVIFTNFSQDHLDYYHDLATYGDAKRRLFDGRNGPIPRRGVFNLDDAFGLELFEHFSGDKYGVGTHSRAACQIVTAEFSPPGLHLTLRWQEQPYALVTPLTGRGNLYNIAQAFAAAMILGIAPAAALAAVAGMAPIPGRLEEIPTGRPFRLFVDFAHKEIALANACSILKSLTPGRLIAVFGCGGDRDRTKRPRMGKVVAETSDVVIVTSDNPRTEDPEAIIEEIVPGILAVRPDFIRICNRREAIRRAIAMAAPGDTILLAGKGHETGQIIGHQIFPFSDQEVARGILGERA